MNNTRELVLDYVAAAGNKDFDHLAELVDDDATFGGTVKNEVRGVDAFVQGFRNLAPVAVRHDVRDIVVDGDKAFVLYDFVTDTDVGAVLCGELLTTRNGRITSSTLIFDWRRWPEVLQEIGRRTAA
jgi:ketosteroid isomerase-like protein